MDHALNGVARVVDQYDSWMEALSDDSAKFLMGNR